MAAKRKSSEKVSVKQKSNGNRNRKSGAKAAENENRSMSLAEFLANPPAWSVGPEQEFPIRLAAWISQKPASRAFTVHEIARDAMAVAKLMGLGTEPEAETAALLAAQLVRESAGCGMLVSEIARDAIAIAEHAFEARRAVEAGECPAGAVAKASAIADAYVARTVYGGDALGMVLGLRFASRFRDTLHVA